jgi:hypothetical protein
MLSLVLVIALAIFVFYSAFQLYANINWGEKPTSGPDLQQLRKRQAELLHVQDVLHGAHHEGKLSQAFVDELDRYCAAELEALKVPER